MSEKLIQHIANILEISFEEVQSSKNFLDFQKFDSLVVIQIAAFLDAEFDCVIEPEQFELLDSLDSINDLIDSN
tara:strand:+ start:2528 stop:2749 length:222 start_codon:yes stop_codon:yes gene_type:complete